MTRAAPVRSLAALIAVGWFWLLFYSVGPITSTSSLVTGAVVLTAGCLVFALWGFAAVRRRPRR